MTTAIAKRALKRRADGTVVLDCVCGTRVDVLPAAARRLPVDPPQYARLTCAACGQQYDGAGWLLPGPDAPVVDSEENLHG